MDAEVNGTAPRILLVKLSSLGDVVHALPVLQDIHAALPGARIDWVVEQSFAPLLRCASGVERVVPCEIRRWRKSFWTSATRKAWRHFKAQLRLEAYDAVIDLQGLTKSALVARLARLTPGGKRYALGNRTEGAGYEAPARWLADIAIPIKPHTHVVQRSRELAAQALGYAFSGAPDFGLKTSLVESLKARGWVEGESLGSSARSVALVHGTSRADKEWPLDHWVALGQRLAAAGYRVALPHGNAAEKATSHAIADALNTGHGAAFQPAEVWPALPLDALTEKLSHCAGVIGVDSGVSHIAVALDLPHVQVYNFETAWRTGPVPPGRQVSVTAWPTPAVEAVWQAWLGCLAWEAASAGQGRQAASETLGA